MIWLCYSIFKKGRHMAAQKETEPSDLMEQQSTFRSSNIYLPNVVIPTHSPLVAAQGGRESEGSVDVVHDPTDCPPYRWDNVCVHCIAVVGSGGDSNEGGS